jgi:hypothetical protein
MTRNINFRRWDTLRNITLPMTIERPSYFTTSGYYVLHEQLRSLYEVAEACSQHRFLVNTNLTNSWFSVPDNVIPAYSMANVPSANHRAWLNSVSDYEGPKVVSLFCETGFVPRFLQKVDWVVLSGFNLKNVGEVLCGLYRLGIPAYVREFNNAMSPMSIPVEIRVREIPECVQGVFNSFALVS